MKKLIITIVIVFGIVGTLFAQNEIGINAKVDLFNKYIWRGMNATDDPVIQPSVDFIYKNFTFTGWGNIELTNVNDNQWNITETDIIIDYSNYLSNLSIIGYSIGAIYYDFPNTRCESTTEIYAGLNLKTMFSPYAKIYKDIDEANGIYVSVGISETLFWDIKTNASIGWGDNDYNHFYWNKSNNKFNDFVLSISRPINIDDLQLVPSLTYVRLIDKNLGSIGDDGSNDIVFGLSLIKKF